MTQDMLPNGSTERRHDYPFIEDADLWMRSFELIDDLLYVTHVLSVRNYSFTLIRKDQIADYLPWHLSAGYLGKHLDEFWRSFKVNDEEEVLDVETDKVKKFLQNSLKLEWQPGNMIYNFSILKREYGYEPLQWFYDTYSTDEQDFRDRAPWLRK